MDVKFDFGELLTISCALHTLDVVYGPNDARDPVMKKVDSILDQMNNTPIDKLYPKACEVIEGVGTINT